jgi:hypothetical protein
MFLISQGESFLPSMPCTAGKRCKDQLPSPSMLDPLMALNSPFYYYRVARSHKICLFLAGLCVFLASLLVQKWYLGGFKHGYIDSFVAGA